MYDAILKVLSRDYDHEVPDIPKSKEFSKEVKKYINKNLKPYGMKISKMSEGYCEASGFITDGKEYLYFNTGDYRWPILGKEWFNDILIRRAENEDDYIGGTNCTCKLCDIGETAVRILN